MKRTTARLIAQSITNEQLQNMFHSAYEKMTDQENRSKVNPKITKRKAWEYMGKDFKLTGKYNTLAKTNMIREFGDYLPEEFKSLFKKRKNEKTA